MKLEVYARIRRHVAANAADAHELPSELFRSANYITHPFLLT